jgi:hypothetical protein
MTRKKARAGHANRSGEFAPPYPPSWIDRLIHWIDRLPGPAWAFYLLASLVLVGGFSILQAREGAYTSSGYRPAHAFVALQPVLALALIHYLDRAASRSFERFRPALRAGSIDEREVQWRLTHLPARATVLASLVGLLLLPLMWALPDPIPLFGLAPTQLSLMSFVAITVLIWIVYSPLLYHTIHQLAWVATIHARYTAADSFDIEPLYAFSGLTVRTALGLMVINYGWQFVFPTPLSNIVSVVLTALFALLAAAVFAWPLWGVHRLLLEEKARLLTDCARRMKATFAEFRRRIDSGRIKGMDDLHKTMSSLEIEHSALTRIPTWPWQPGTIRGLAAALFLPILLWLIQFGLERMLK